MKILCAATLAYLINSLADISIGLRTGKERFTPGAEIESCSTHEYRHGPTALNVLDLCYRFARPLARGVVYFGGHKINQVMRDTLAFCHGNLGGGDFNSLVNLNRVAVDDLATQMERHLDAQCAFA